ncbi:hypothetical protein CYLTODRAFT_383137 [Cylindrobasidium torrendii FP15055 ss-10]|uniref:BAG domain-containing protein n=1 Tax=Cylindrobasidium torrendii FP15055 ss-10 TaxID=1314674 RepID=A0A0D7AY65_9AGAR|nr:hypothetical protein CYLTODRAFT_383137 [Cylindrobasidium torrendii FP15055 ss-10]
MFVKWGNQKFTFDVAVETCLGSLIAQISQETGLQEFKLIYKGAVLKDENLPLSAYHLRSASTLTLLPTVDAPGPPAPSTDKSSQHGSSVIRQELNTIRESLVPSLSTFLETLPSQGSSSPPMQKEHVRLGELLLQALLRLDGVSTDGDDQRAERKAAVKEVQGLLDTLDAAWTSSK